MVCHICRERPGVRFAGGSNGTTRAGTGRAFLAQHGAWTAQLDHYDAMHRLQSAGIAAGAVLSTGEFVENEHVRSRGFMEKFDHPVAGEKLYPGVPFKMSETPR